MIRKFQKITVAIIIVLACAIIASFLTCSKKQDDKPEIAGCNSIKYKGKTYTNVGCEPGIRSFNITYGDNPCFHVECSRGCLSSVFLCSGSGSLSKTIVGPDDEP